MAPTWSAFLKYKLETAVERGSLGGAVRDTLLGPEGSDDTRRLELARSPVGGLVGSVVCVGWFFWSWASPITRFVCVGCGVPVVF